MQVKTCSEFLAPKNISNPRAPASVRDSISKCPVYVLHIVHRTECCSIFSKASIENPTALSNVNVEAHNQGSCKDETRFVSDFLCWLCEPRKRSNTFGLLFFFFWPLIPLICTEVPFVLHKTRTLWADSHTHQFSCYTTLLWCWFVPACHCNTTTLHPESLFAIQHYVWCFDFLWHHIIR